MPHDTIIINRNEKRKIQLHHESLHKKYNIFHPSIHVASPDEIRKLELEKKKGRRPGPCPPIHTRHHNNSMAICCDWESSKYMRKSQEINPLQMKKLHICKSDLQMCRENN
jgi:hypothetical protein